MFENKLPPKIQGQLLKGISLHGLCRIANFGHWTEKKKKEKDEGDVLALNSQWGSYRINSRAKHLGFKLQDFSLKSCI